MTTKIFGIMAALLFCGIAAVPVFAQESEIDIVGTLRFASPRVTQVQSLQYGVGSRYTDTTDREFEELIPPFTPPGGYLIVLDRECSSIDGDPPCYWKQDLRGVPDSVGDGEELRFSIDYDVLIVDNVTGAGLTLAILAPDWPENVDSIHMVDIQLPRAFNHTFTGPEEVQITDEFTKYIKMTVYYNLEVSSVEQGSGSTGKAGALTLQPNPSGAREVMVSAPFDRGDQLLVTDMLGRRIREINIAEKSAAIRIETGGLPAGEYLVVRLNEKGEIIGSDHLQIVR